MSRAVRRISARLAAPLLAVAVDTSGQAPALTINVSFQPDHLIVNVRNTSGKAHQIDGIAIIHLTVPSTEASPIRRFWTSASFGARLPPKGSRRASILVPPKGSLDLPLAVSPLEWNEGMSPDGPRIPVSVPAGWYELSVSMGEGASKRIMVVVDRTGQIASSGK